MIPCSKGLWFYEIVYSSGGGGFPQLKMRLPDFREVLNGVLGRERRLSLILAKQMAKEVGVRCSWVRRLWQGEVHGHADEVGNWYSISC